MEALLVEEVPGGAEWHYEPKWDGFRCLAYKGFDDGAGVTLQSKSGQDLTRYFPEMVAGLAGLKASRFVLDGELIVPQGSGSSFEQLLMRIHPAASRVAKLSAEHPSMFVVFDLLVDITGKQLVDRPLAQRRAALDAFASRFFGGHPTLAVSPILKDAETARALIRSRGSGGGLDGIVAKRRDLAYQSGERTGMQKVKRMRTADCVVGGFRYAEKPAGNPPRKEVGSLLLGLFDDDGALNHVGFTSAMSASMRAFLTPLLEALIKTPGFTGRTPGGPSRWSSKRSMEWEPLRQMLVAEVQYDHFSEGRFRHGTRFLRWRPDKLPRQCGMDQITQAKTSSLQLIRADQATPD